MSPCLDQQAKRYITLKSVLKFGSTVHICIGVIFWYFLINLLDTIIHRPKDNNMSTPLMVGVGFQALMGIQYFIYLFLFLPLGVLLHRGVKKESVPVLQWSTVGFLILQVYGGLTQYQYGFVLTSFIPVTFPSLQFESELILEIGVGIFVTFFYVIIIAFYVRQLKSHFYVPPIYPCRVEYFYYPEDTSSNITVFHKQVPCQIMHNYQNTAYFVQKELSHPSASSSMSRFCKSGQRQGDGQRGSYSGLANGRIPVIQRNRNRPW